MKAFRENVDLKNYVSNGEWELLEVNTIVLVIVIAAVVVVVVVIIIIIVVVIITCMVATISPGSLQTNTQESPADI